MALPLTRAQLRDEIRRKCGRKPLYDITEDPADIGQPAPNQPEPTNTEINAVLDLITRQINAKCRFAANTSITLNIAAQPATALGPYYTSIADISTGVMNQGRETITELRRVVYNDSVTNPTLLKATSMYQMDARGYSPDAQPPGIPEFYWIQGYKLALWPGPAQNCTLQIVAGTALTGFLTDGDIVDELPLIYHDAWLYGAITELGGRNSRDMEWQGYVQSNAPTYTQYLTDIGSWAGSQQNPESSPGFTVQSYRRGTGLRSNRR